MGPHAARALVCGQSSELPTFTATLDPNAVPSPLPADAESSSSLELYRTKLEIYRQNIIEGYNKKLIAYGETLKALDKRFRRAMENGACSPAEYETLKDELAPELTKTGSDYLDPYYESLNAYKAWVKWYQVKRLA